MKRRWPIVAMVAVALLGGALLFRHGLHRGEPSYRGRSFSSWIQALGEYERYARLRYETRGGTVRPLGPAPAQGVALSAFRTMGRPAVPYLVEVLWVPGGEMMSGYWSYYAQTTPRWRRFLPRPRADAICLRRAALSALAELVDVADAAWPELLTVATGGGDPATRQRAVETLRALSQRHAGVNAALSQRLLVAGLHEANAVALVERYALGAPLAVQALVRAARNGTLDVRHAALVQLRRIGRGAGEAAPYLLGAITETNRTLRCRACEALGSIQPDAAQAVPVLLAVLDDPESLVRASAANALAVYGAQAASAAPKLTELYRTKDGVEKYCFGRALSQIAPEAAVQLGIE